MSEPDEAAEHDFDRRAGDRMNNTIALLVAITATALALVNIKDGNVVQAMAVARSQSVNAWSHYQAKSLKQALAQASLDQLQLQLDLGADTRPGLLARLTTRIADLQKAVDRYETEKLEIKQRAETFEKDYDRLNLTDDQLDMAEACLSMALALYGVTALTRKRWLLNLSLLVALWGIGHAAAGFAGVQYRPAWFARLLG